MHLRRAVRHVRGPTVPAPVQPHRCLARLAPGGQWHIVHGRREHRAVLDLGAHALRPTTAGPLARVLRLCSAHEGGGAGDTAPCCARARIPTPLRVGRELRDH